jgi:hypothetical protein
MTTRFAIVKGARDSVMLERYLPSNYYIVGGAKEGFIIAGSDNDGWTLDDYVIPRLSSGNMGCRELVEKPF